MAEQFGIQIPNDVTPAAFFKELMPQIIAKAKVEIPELAEANFKMQVNIDSSVFGVTIEGGVATVTDGDLEGNIVKLEIGESDWRDTVTGEIEDAGGFTDFKLAGNPQAMQILNGIKGQLNMELTREGKDPMKTSITFNGSTEPTATMKLTLQDYLDINSKKANGQMLFMQGRIMVEGDMGLIMQLQPLQNL